MKQLSQRELSALSAVVLFFLIMNSLYQADPLLRHWWIPKRPADHP
jgi:hypothetical protein